MILYFYTLWNDHSTSSYRLSSSQLWQHYWPYSPCCIAHSHDVVKSVPLILHLFCSPTPPLWDHPFLIIVSFSKRPILTRGTQAYTLLRPPPISFPYSTFSKHLALSNSTCILLPCLFLIVCLPQAGYKHHEVQNHFLLL